MIGSKGLICLYFGRDAVICGWIIVPYGFRHQYDIRATPSVTNLFPTSWPHLVNIHKFLAIRKHSIIPCRGFVAKSRFSLRRKRPRNKTNTASTRLLRFHGSFFSARFCSCIWRFVRPSWSSTCLQMRNGLISVDAYKKSRAFYIYERKLRYCIEVFFRVRKRASGNASMEKVLCVSVLVKFPRAETRAFLPQWKAGLKDSKCNSELCPSLSQKSLCLKVCFHLLHSEILLSIHWRTKKKVKAWPIYFVGQD